jgi:hypothetical protein
MAVTIKVIKEVELRKPMDFSNRNAQSQPVAPNAHTTAAVPSNKRNKSDNSKWGRLGVVAAVAAVVILLLALVATVATSDSNKSKEAGYVDSSKLQAVFLNTGQVYFGNIEDMNNKFFELTNIYYLQTASNGSAAANSNTSVSLVKLGCELHEPFDKMIINRDQVTFWENLQDGGQVAKAVTTFEKQNPNGQKCADQSASSSTNSGNTVQSAGTNNAAKP